MILGCANQAGEDNRNIARMSLLLAGIPPQIPGATVNRLCGSGMNAVSIGAQAIASGEAEVVIAGGVEKHVESAARSFESIFPLGSTQKLEDTTLGWRFVNPQMWELYGADSMAETAENVAAEHSISRAAQDAFSLRSQQRCAASAAAGFHCEEIVPVPSPRAPWRIETSIPVPIPPSKHLPG